MKHFDYALDDFIPCTTCGTKAVDIHHIERRGIGGSKNKDYIENLMGLCRDCHDKCEQDKMDNIIARIKHLENVCHQIYARIEYEKRYENRKK